MNIRISTYKSLLTKCKTWVVVSNKEPQGSKNYKEAHIRMKNGQLYYIITDGFKYIGIEKPIRNNLKSAINIIEGKIVPLPWYCR